MKNKSLSVVANQRKMGDLFYHNHRLTFQYGAEWQAWDQAFPLSVSMPLPQREHEHPIVEAFLWGLLPDNPKVLDQWSRRFHVSSQNVFSLLQHVGEDCAGAIQFVAPEKESLFIGQPYTEQVDWLANTDLLERLQRVLNDHGLQRSPEDRGQFSLAGAQPKIALYLSPTTQRWGVPFGMTPTTHILKPASKDFDGFAENEHFCLTLSKKIGLRTTQSWVIHPDELPTIVVQRYDRLYKNEKYLRIHQEDLCQATGVHPNRKYQSDGGPGISQTYNLLRNISSNPNEDIETFAKTLIFNFLISGTDAHAKNYSLLIAPRSQIRLAPLYDLASSLPYPHSISPFKAKLAMKIGNEYKIRYIQCRHWQTCANQLHIEWETFKTLFESVAEQTLQHVSETEKTLGNQGLTHPIISTLSKELVGRVNSLLPNYLKG